MLVFVAITNIRTGGAVGKSHDPEYIYPEGCLDSLPVNLIDYQILFIELSSIFH